MTNYYQPLNLTTNKWAKDYMKAKFSEWYSQQVREAIDSGKSIEDIEIKFPLSVMKPLHGSWLIDMCNELTSENSKEVPIAGGADNPIQPALLIWDVFRGQKTEAVLQVLKENIIETE